MYISFINEYCIVPCTFPNKDTKTSGILKKETAAFMIIYTQQGDLLIMYSDSSIEITSNNGQTSFPGDHFQDHI